MRKAQPLRAIRRLMSSPARAPSNAGEPSPEKSTATGLLRPVMLRTEEFLKALRQAAVERSCEFTRKM